MIQMLQPPMAETESIDQWMDIPFLVTNWHTPRPLVYRLPTTWMCHLYTGYKFKSIGFNFIFASLQRINFCLRMTAHVVISFY
jgi:hypothetical protein